MIRFFKSGFPTQYLAITAIALLIWGAAFISPPQMPPPEGPAPLYMILYDLLVSYPRLAAILGFLLVTAESFWLANILGSNDLIHKNASLPALVFMLMSSFFPGLLTLTPVNISMVMLLLILQNLLGSYKKPEHLNLVYAAGFFTTLAGLFYLPFYLWIFLIPICFVVFRSGEWREWIVSIIGMITPLIFLSVYFYWTDELPQHIRSYISFFGDLRITYIRLTPGFMIPAALTGLLAITGILSLWSGPMEKTVEVRAKISLFFWIILFTVISFPFAHSLALYHAGLAAPAFALTTTGMLISMKKAIFANWILGVYLILILLNNSIVYNALTQP